MDEAQAVHGPVQVPGLGWEVRLYFDTEESAAGFAVFATAGFTAHQTMPSPVLRWVPFGGGETVGPLPPVPLLWVHSVDTRSRDNVVEITYSGGS